MDSKNDGGPAFPQQQECVDLDGNLVGHEVCGGMTLRDWFAGQERLQQDDLGVQTAEALMGEKMPDGKAPTLDRVRWWALAEARFKFMKADAMLEARK